MGIRPLRARFARRLFLRFLLAAALPMGAIGLFVVLQVSQVYSGEAREHLLRAARSYGHAVHGRLQLSEGLLIAVARAGSMPPARKGMPAPFAAVAIYPARGPRRLIAGDGALLPAAAGGLPGPELSSKTRLRVAADGSGRTLMVRTQHDPAGARSTVAAVLDPAFLFGGRDAWPYGVEFCVVSARDGGGPVFCPDGGFASAAATRPAGHDNLRLWRFEVADAPMLALHWDLFLPSAFDSEPWRIIAAEPRALALKPALEFLRFIPLAGLLAVAVAGWAGFRQSRRLSAPLQRLNRGVAEIAAGHFDTRVPVEGDDEFAALGQEVNRMAARIGRQFAALELLAAADRSILAAADLDAMVAELLGGLDGVLHCRWVGILLLEGDGGGRLSWRVGGGRARSRPLALSRQERALLDTAAPVVRPSGGLAAALRPEEGPAPAGLWALTVRQRGALAAVLLLGDGERVELHPEDLEHGRAVADRLAVALSAACREQMLLHQAHYDPLTELPNRTLFMQRIEAQVARSRRMAQGFALLFLDLDRFKNVNDSVGHGTGDRLLVEAAARLRGAVREIDTAARWGGDEFVVLSPAAGPATAGALAAQLIETLSRPYTIDGHEHHVGASIGIALYPDDGADAEQLLKNADVAMYRAKETGRGCHAFFEQSMDAAIRRRTQLEGELRTALECNQFTLVYQPLLRLDDGRVESAEALLRWRHPRRGTVPPGEFIGVLEDSGLIDRVGIWVLRAACEQYRRGFGAAPRPPRIAVNVSPRQFWVDGFAESVRAVLKETGMPPQALELEITERVFVDDVERAIDIVDELRAHGVRFALDDFGTGHSSMSYLRRLPVDTLKIDRSFVIDVERDSRAAAILEAIIALGRTVGKTVVAEGIETQGQLNFLRERGCALGQGFYFSRPLPADELAVRLARGAFEPGAMVN